jgi:capsular exopolysaccharide synthesis family protein
MNQIPPPSTKELSPWHIQRRGDIDDSDFVYAPERDTRHPRDYWKILSKHHRLVVLVFLAVFASWAYVNFSATNLYTASATLKIEPQNPAITGIAELFKAEAGAGPYDYYQTQFALLKSRDLAARIITELRLQSNPSFNARVASDNPALRIMPWLLHFLQPLIDYGDKFFGPAPIHKTAPGAGASAQRPSVHPRLISRYLSFLKVTPVKNTRLVQIEFKTPDPHLSQQLADAHVTGFIRMNIDDRSKLTEEAREFLDKKNVDLKAKLEASQAALNQYRQKHGLVSLEKGENVVVDRLVVINNQLTTARTQRLEAEALYRTVENKKHQDLAQVMTQGLIPQLRASIASMEADRAKLSTIFKPEHPRLQELIEQINEARRNLNAEIDKVVKGIESSYVAARARELALEREAQKQQQAALDQKQVGVEYAVLQEEVNVNRALYESVLKRLNETSVSNDLTLSNMLITQRAEIPLLPSSPNTPRNLLLAGALGLFFGVGLAFMLEYLDNKMSTPEHVGRAVALNTFGIVPDLRSLHQAPSIWNGQNRSWFKGLINMRPFGLGASTSSAKELILTTQHPLSIVTESYRSIRTSLLFSRAEKPPQIILLTSPAPGEGKTSTSLNLGIALAQDGHRVLVIDADLRKGCCHSRLGLKNHKGLSNILTGNLLLEEGIQQTSVNGLSLITRGVCPPNPGDLLGSNKMKQILTSLRALFEFILIDSPPGIAISDAAILSVISDAVILVFHGQKTTTDSARQLLERLDGIRAPVLGVILNGVNMQNPDYSYLHHYYSDGYGTDEENKNGNGSSVETIDSDSSRG